MPKPLKVASARASERMDMVDVPLAVPPWPANTAGFVMIRLATPLALAAPEMPVNTAEPALFSALNVVIVIVSGLFALALRST